MGVAGIVTLIVLGILLILLEFFVVPGVTVAGIGGFILLVLGIYFSYSTYGVSVGNILLLSIFGGFGGFFYFAYRRGAWKTITLSTEVKSTIKPNVDSLLKIGAKGLTISRLAPMGKVMIDNQIYEAGSNGGFIDENIEIEVIKINNNKIIVKQIN